MAKALYGHLAGPSVADQAEMVRLRRRIAQLEAEMLRVKAENDALLAAQADLVEAELARATPAPA